MEIFKNRYQAKKALLDGNHNDKNVIVKVASDLVDDYGNSIPGYTLMSYTDYRNWKLQK